jgi:hypothetical protein
MALTRYVVTAAVTLPQGTVITTSTAEPGTGGAARRPSELTADPGPRAATVPASMRSY